MTVKDKDQGLSSEFNRLSQSEIVLDRLADREAPQGLVLDIAKYVGYLDGSGLSEAESKIVLAEIWRIVTAFVDLGFGLHPVQQAMDKSKMIQGPGAGPVVTSGSVHSDNNTTKDEARERAARRERIHEPR
jgi:hypothetical protein